MWGRGTKKAAAISTCTKVHINDTNLHDVMLNVHDMMCISRALLKWVAVTNNKGVR